MSILLGQTLRDNVTGYEGIATTYTEFDNANKHYYGLQQKVGKDGKVPDAHYVDHHNLEVVVNGPTAKFVQPDPAMMTIALNQKVVDKTSGFKGVVTRRTVFLNGCVYFLIIGDFNSKTGKVDESFVQSDRISWPRNAKTAEPTPAKRPPGGPAFVPTR